MVHLHRHLPAVEVDLVRHLTAEVVADVRRVHLHLRDFHVRVRRVVRRQGVDHPHREVDEGLLLDRRQCRIETAVEVEVDRDRHRHHHGVDQYPTVRLVAVLTTLVPCVHQKAEEGALDQGKCLYFLSIVAKSSEIISRLT